MWSLTRCWSLILYSSWKRHLYILKAIVSITLILQKNISLLGFQITFYGDLSLPISSFMTLCYLPNFILEMVEQKITGRTSHKDLQVRKGLGSLAWCRHLPGSSCQPLHRHAKLQSPKHWKERPGSRGKPY